MSLASDHWGVGRRAVVETDAGEREGVIQAVDDTELPSTVVVDVGGEQLEVPGTAIELEGGR